MKTYAFIDASNLFYGGRKTLGWSIDHEKLMKYLKERYQVNQMYYFGGVKIDHFPFDYLKYDTVPLEEVAEYMMRRMKEKDKFLNDIQLELLYRRLGRIRFFQKLEKFGYTLVLKPVKVYENSGFDDVPKQKANCDVDMTLYMLKEQSMFDRALILSGDGDFLPVMKFLKNNKKDILVLARSPKTAREIKRFAGDKFMDFDYLRERLQRTDMEIKP